MKYQRFFEIRVTHSAYAHRHCTDVSVVPRAGHASGERAMARHRMLARSTTGGLDVAIRVSDEIDATVPELPLSDGLVLGFELRVSGTAFNTVTDLSASATRSTPVYRGGVAGDRQLCLVQQADNRLAPDVAALIEIVGIQRHWLVEVPRFTLDLASRRFFWVYYLLTRRTHSGAPRIEQETTRAAAKFSCRHITVDNTSSRADAMGRYLIEQYKGSRCFRLVSKRPLSISGPASGRLSLHVGEESLMRDLPRPSIDSTTVLAPKSGEPRTCLFRVVEY